MYRVARLYGKRTDQKPVAFQDQPDSLVITLGGKPLAEYLKNGDSRTSRPYLHQSASPCTEREGGNGQHPRKDSNL